MTSLPQVITLPSASTTEGNTGMTSVANTWLLSRETERWVGPINIVTDPDVLVSFAVIPLRSRPQDTDWTDPVQSPDDATMLGVYVLPVSDEGNYGIWVRGVRGEITVILEPPQVGYLART